MRRNGGGLMDQIGPILTALASVILAIGGVLTGMARRSPGDFRALKKEIRRLTRRLQTALLHIGRLEEKLVTATGKKAPARPKELEADWGIEDEHDDPPKAVTAS